MSPGFSPVKASKAQSLDAAATILEAAAAVEPSTDRRRSPTSPAPRQQARPWLHPWRHPWSRSPPLFPCAVRRSPPCVVPYFPDLPVSQRAFTSSKWCWFI
ncbi:hypothetical protein ZWY2020_052848 [Hordeum vulgare]|nr:hypothetical protein ZWY2020_052848 [Hordeum vulgare]